MRTSSSNKTLMTVFHQAANCIQTLEDRVMKNALNRDDDSIYPSPEFYDEPDYSDGRRRRGVRLTGGGGRGKSKYRLHAEYPTQPGHRGLISRTKDGR